jgi:hypothetical protein
MGILAVAAVAGLRAFEVRGRNAPILRGHTYCTQAPRAVKQRPSCTAFRLPVDCRNV